MLLLALLLLALPMLAGDVLLLLPLTGLERGLAAAHAVDAGRRADCFLISLLAGVTGLAATAAHPEDGCNLSGLVT
jgi:hypothetical protein